MTTTDLGFHHVWRAGASPTAPTLLLLHGTGGDEHDLVPLADRVAPGANVLSPRGRVLEHGMPRFFRRFGEGNLDVDDLKARAVELADFVDGAAKAYDFDRRRVYALGYSNGANVALGMLYERPRALAGAVLMRAMDAYAPAPGPTIDGAPVLVLAGERDPYSRAPTGDRLAERLRQRGADVELRYAHAGHELAAEDLAAAREWLRERFPQ